MNRQASLTLIGVFVVGAICLLVVAILAFGGGGIFGDEQKFVVYFDGSVKGLRIGAPVNFRGAPLGEVTDIQLVYNPQDQSILIPVVFEIHADKVSRMNGSGPARSSNPAKEMELLINKGLRAELAIESLVTGQLYIQLDYHEGTDLNLLGHDHEYPEVPSVPSKMEILKENIKAIPLKDIAATAQKVLHGLDGFVNSPQIMQAIESFTSFMEDGSQLAKNTNRFLIKFEKGIDPSLQNLDDVMQEAKAALAAIHKTFAASGKTVGNESPLNYKLQSALNEVAAAARAVRSLSDYLERHPEALLRGKTGR